MTLDNALTEAVRRWGPGAYVEVLPFSPLSHRVGVVEAGSKRVRGTGASWKEALKWAGELEDLVKRGER